MRTIKNLALSAASLCLSGCFLITDSSERLLNGCWYEVIDIAGSGVSFTLQEDGSTISGTGSYSMEAGIGGTLSISGQRSGNDLTLSFTFTNYVGSFVQNLDGTVESRFRFDAFVVDAAGHHGSVPAVFRRCP